jgi:hypothetical protein
MVCLIPKEAFVWMVNDKRHSFKSDNDGTTDDGPNQYGKRHMPVYLF